MNGYVFIHTAKDTFILGQCVSFNCPAALGSVSISRIACMNPVDP